PVEPPSPTKIVSLFNAQTEYNSGPGRLPDILVQLKPPLVERKTVAVPAAPPAITNVLQSATDIARPLGAMPTNTHCAEIVSVKAMTTIKVYNFIFNLKRVIQYRRQSL